MKKTEKITKEYIYQETTYLTCDLCGRENIENNKDNWGSGYELDEIKIKRTEGANYPGDSYGDVTEIHMCPECWETKFIKWVKSFNITKDFYTYDY